MTDVLEREWDINIDDRTEDEILGDRNFESEAALIQEEAKTTRPSAKSESVLRHDLAQFAVIKDARKTNTKTWLLTADRSLIKASARLMPSDIRRTMAAGVGSSAGVIGREISDLHMPYCFSLAGFLQSISPFTASADEESSLAEIFSSLVSDYLSLYENLFDMREMNLLMEWHEDVMITPAEQLVPALDYVKTKVLQGRQYSLADLPRVALELKKFLSKSIEERHQAFENEAARREEEIRKEQQARLDVERELQIEKDGRLLDSAQLQEARTRELAATSIRQWRERLIIGLTISAVIWFLQNDIVNVILSKGLDPLRWTTPVHVIVVAVAALFLIVPTLLFVASSSWRAESKAVAFSALFLIVIAMSHLLTDDVWNRWASRIEVAVFAGGIVYLVMTRNRKNNSPE